MHSLLLRVVDLTRWSHAAENFCHALDVVTLLESIVSILLLTQKRYIAFSLEDGHPWFYHGRKNPCCSSPYLLSVPQRTLIGHPWL